MVNVVARVTDDDGNTMPNMRCRDVSLLLFMFSSATRRGETAALQWCDLTFDKRGVVVLIRKSKVDQERKSQPIAMPSTRARGSALPGGGAGDVESLEWRRWR